MASSASHSDSAGLRNKAAQRLHSSPDFHRHRREYRSERLRLSNGGSEHVTGGSPLYLLSFTAGLAQGDEGELWGY